MKKVNRFLIKVGARTPFVKYYIAKYKNLQRYIASLEKQYAEACNTIDEYDRANRDLVAEIEQYRGPVKKYRFIWPVRKKDLLKITFLRKKAVKKVAKSKPPFTIGWVVPPVGNYISGGHVDIFRTIQYLEKKGHKNQIYFYDPQKNTSLKELRARLINYPEVSADLFYNQDQFKQCNALFATSWPTAYPVANSPLSVKKFYYVQDFEPYFEPAGSYYILSENTYKFGLHGITLGKWLATKLSSEYGMTCDHMDLGMETSEYRLINKEKRKKILFYARPSTARRGFELGILALEVFNKKHPEYEINFLGSDTSNYDIPFPYVNRGVLKTKELNELYNECASGLVLSFTNMSLLPLEMLSAGCAVTLNDAEHTRMVPYADMLDYAHPTPLELANQLYESIVRADPKAINEALLAKKELRWDSVNERVEAIISRELL